MSSLLSRPFLHTQDMYFVFVQLLSSGSAWFAIIIIVITCLFPDVVKKVFYRHLQPTNTQKSQVAHRGQTASTAALLVCPQSVSLFILPELKYRVNLLFFFLSINLQISLGFTAPPFWEASFLQKLCFVSCSLTLVA